MNNILVLGEGFVGKEFKRHGYTVWGKDKFTYNTLNSEETMLDKFSELFKGYDTIINCIAKSNTRWCEDPRNFKEAVDINGYLPAMLSFWCNDNNVKFVHISTGCLYDRTDIINAETELIAAHCNYTISKWIGEKHLHLETDLILRPRLLFSDIKDRNNLLCKLQKYDAFVNDQLDSFTCTSTIVGATRALLEEGVSGVFNVAQDGAACIWQLANWCGLTPKKFIRMEELRKQQGLYLVNNVMDISKLKKYYQPTNIETAVKLCYNELK